MNEEVVTRDLLSLSSKLEDVEVLIGALVRIGDTHVSSQRQTCRWKSTHLWRNSWSDTRSEASVSEQSANIGTTCVLRDSPEPRALSQTTIWTLFCSSLLSRQAHTLPVRPAPTIKTRDIVCRNRRIKQKTGVLTQSTSECVDSHSCSSHTRLLCYKTSGKVDTETSILSK